MSTIKDVILSPNFWQSRKGLVVSAIVIHKPEANWESVKNTVMNPGSNVSYHFVIKKDGSIIQFVPTQYAA